jgi:hypothetical protein
MARIAGAVVFIGGAKWQDGKLTEVDGVRAELTAAREAGAFLLPVASTGGTAKSIADELLKFPGRKGGGNSTRPSNASLRDLASKDSPKKIAANIISILLQR